MSNESSVRSLLAGIGSDDPRLAAALDQLADDVYTAFDELFPPVSRTFSATGQTNASGNVANFMATLYADNLKLTWDQIFAATYEIRYLSGTHVASDWGTASSILITTTTSADINPIVVPLTTGTHTFLIKSTGIDGTESATATVVVIDVPVISSPVITTSIVGNFVLLYWVQPSSVWLIDHYNLYKNGVLQGEIQGSFKSIFESAGGTYTYLIEAVDIVGNVGVSASVAATVSNPTDFSLRATLTSTFSGTKTNAKLETIDGVSNLLACVDIAQSWTNHFSSNAWTNINDQIAAGYAIYIEPALLTGEYDEVFDFGSIINNVIVVMDWNTLAVAGLVSTSTSTIETSTDNITYTAPVVASTVFATSVRYVRWKMKFVGSTNKSLAYFYNLRCLLNVHIETDNGTQAVLAADVGGTTVTFAKAFKSVDSITLAAVSTVFRTAIYDFSFPVNPTTFKILLFDAAGVRQNGTVSWIARGIL